MPEVAGRFVTNLEKTYDNSYSYIIENTKIMLYGCLKSTAASFAFANLASTKMKNRTIEKLWYPHAVPNVWQPWVSKQQKLPLQILSLKGCNITNQLVRFLMKLGAGSWNFQWFECRN